LPDRQRFSSVANSVAFAHDRLLPRLHIQRKAASVALNPVCSL